MVGWLGASSAGGMGRDASSARQGGEDGREQLLLL